MKGREETKINGVGKLMANLLENRGQKIECSEKKDEETTNTYIPNSVPGSTGTRTKAIVTNPIEKVTTTSVSVPAVTTPVFESPALSDCEELLNDQEDVRKFIICDEGWRGARYFSEKPKVGLSNSSSSIITVVVRDPVCSSLAKLLRFKFDVAASFAENLNNCVMTSNEK